MWFQRAATSDGAFLVHDNSVSGNSRAQMSPASPLTHYLAVAGSGSSVDIYNNSINNNVVGTTGGSIGLYVIFNNTLSKNIYNNTIANITKANGSFQGLYNTNGATGQIFNNHIRNIVAEPTATGAAIMGIYHAAGSNMFYFNNMVSELYNPGSVSTLGYDYNTLTGIYVEGSADYKTFYNNTIFLNATTSSSDFGSAAFCASNFTGVTLKNNIFVNLSASAGNGKTSGIQARTTNYSNFVSNYNDIYAGTPGPSNVIFLNYNTAYQTLADYKAFIQPNELQSVTDLPPFVNVATQPYDLHMKTNVITQCEAGGVVLGSP
jgi:hypothetical protein